MALLTPVSAWEARLPGLPPPHDLFVPPPPAPGQSVSDLRSIIEDFRETPQRQLFLTSQRGAGKSQLVRELQHALEHPDDGSPPCEAVYVSLSGTTGSIFDADVRDVLFLLARALAAVAARNDPHDRDIGLDEPSRHALDVWGRSLVDRYALSGPRADRAGAESEAWFGQVESWLRVDAKDRGEFHERVPIQALIGLVNALLRQASAGRSIVLLIDDTDKIGGDHAKRLFLEQSAAFEQLRAGFVITYPYWLNYHGGMARHRTCTLLNVSVVHRDQDGPDGVLPGAVSWFRDLLGRLIDPAWLGPGVMERLVWVSAGVPLELGHLLRPAVRNALARSGTQVDLQDLAASERLHLQELVRMAQTESRRNTLMQVRTAKKLTDEAAWKLVDLGLVFEYCNGGTPPVWYDVHPLLRPEVDSWIREEAERKAAS